MKRLMQFHEELNKAIRLWAQMIQALDRAGRYDLAWSLMDIQPDAERIDTVNS